MGFVIATLTNGREVIASSVDIVLGALKQLADRYGPIPLYELRQLCRDEDHLLQSKTAEAISACGLLLDWNPVTKQAMVEHTVRDIVLASVQGEQLPIVIRTDIVVGIKEVDE